MENQNIYFLTKTESFECFLLTGLRGGRVWPKVTMQFSAFHPSAKTDEIKSAYRRLTKEFHPDNYSGRAISI